ncbi:hypothetical protein [Methanolobus sp. WCC5]|uniref:hypothetical protein n=1 Tax=Methanolobus sp. WCC5 TaxID=3125785 RepID=UPI003252B5D1
MQAPVKQVNALSTIEADTDEATLFDLVGPEDYLEEKMGASGCRFNEGFASDD